MNHDWRRLDNPRWPTYQCSACRVAVQNRSPQPDAEVLAKRGPCPGTPQPVTLPSRESATPETIREELLTSLAALPDPADLDLCRARIEHCQTVCADYLAHGACRLRGSGCTAWSRWREAIVLGSCDRFDILSSKP